MLFSDSRHKEAIADGPSGAGRMTKHFDFGVEHE